MTENGYPVVNPDSMESSEPGVFIGGDLAGVSETTVESVNDGKTAAWFMHTYIQVHINTLIFFFFCITLPASYVTIY